MIRARFAPKGSGSVFRWESRNGIETFMERKIGSNL